MEWTVVTVSVVLLGMFATVGAPIIRLNSNITRLNVTLDRMKQDVAEQKASAKESHRRLWTHNEEQDRRLDDHEKRITIIENRE